VKERMRKIMFCIIAAILILNSVIATGLVIEEVIEADKTPVVLNPPDGEEIPTIGEVHIRTEYDGSFDCIFTGDDRVEMSNNVTQVRVNWTVENSYNVYDNISIRVRIREWTTPLPVLIFFLFGKYGDIETEKRKEKFNIEIKPGNESNFSLIGLTINPEPAEITGAAFFWTIHPKMNGFYNFEWSSLYIKKPKV
jgi:hypothetical protein